MKEKDFEPVHDTFLKGMHLIKAYITVHADRISVQDAKFLQFMAKNIFLQLYAEACICSGNEMISDLEFNKRSEELYHKAGIDMVNNEIDNMIKNINKN